MGSRKSLKKNMIMSIILTGSNFIFPMLTYSYVVRILTPEETGKVAFVNSILQYFFYVASLGIPSYGVREYAKVRDDKEASAHLVQELMIINFISTIIAYIGLVFVVLNIKKLYCYKDLFGVMSVCIILNTIGVEWLYKALEEYSYITVRSLVFKCLSVVLTFFFVRDRSDVIWYAFLSVFTISANNICNFVNARKYISFNKIGSYNLIKHLKPICTLFGASVMITIYANFDVSMLGFISTEHEVGLYSAAWKIKGVVLSVSTAVTSVMIPRMAYYFKQNQKKEMREMILKSLRISLLLAAPIATFIIEYPEHIIEFVCGEIYVEAASTLRMLTLCVFPMILSNLFGNQILIPMGMEKYYSQSVFVGMWINIFLNLLLIPRWGSMGAAIGTLATETWNAIWMSGKVKEYREILINNIDYKIYILPLILGVIISRLLYFFVSSYAYIIQLIVTASVFFLVYYLGLLVLKEPIIVELTKSLLMKYNRLRK